MIRPVASGILAVLLVACGSQGQDAIEPPSVSEAQSSDRLMDEAVRAADNAEGRSQDLPDANQGDGR
ncbi:MAG: hypothetical protein AVDCRST_MAG09-556 [uncultured Sphingomonas sp.]|uniref:Secreted protein n=1 Tax=uncultured Sphingomonas sp. TaxID=158754 RepID=A0A6J4SNY6_9SPHN|nr:MAG: hypothetical protein AVDCRST_MAG09-556 [uncultured Sphingomonas sp.]